MNEGEKRRESEEGCDDYEERKKGERKEKIEWVIVRRGVFEEARCLEVSRLMFDRINM